MISVPRITASRMLPPGKAVCACRNRNTPPTATFIPKVFMMKASKKDTSRISPVELRTKTPACSSDGDVGSRLAAVIGGAFLSHGAGGARRFVVAAVHHVLDVVVLAVALDLESEPVRPVVDLGELHR